MIFHSRFLPLACLMILLLALNPSPAGADWVPGFHLPGTDGVVKAMIVHDGELYLGGDFTRINDTRAVGFAKWDGYSLSNLNCSGVFDFAEWQGDLYILNEKGVYRWTGTDLIQIANGGFYCLEVWDDKLILGGSSSFALEDVVAHGVAAWDGVEWQPLVSGLNGAVVGLACYDGDLIAIGWFNSDTEGNFLPGIARFDGTVWSSVSGKYIHNDDTRKKALVIHDGDLYVSIESPGKIENCQVSYLARWDGTAWCDEGGGLENYPTFLISHPGGLIVSGYHLAGDLSIDLGYTFFYVDHILTPVGGGINRYSYTAAYYQDRWHFGGDFNRVNYLGDNVVTYHLATLDGQQWHPFGNNPGNGVSGNINFMSMVAGELYVGGQCWAAGTTPTAGIAIWDGWQWRAIPGSEVLGQQYAMIQWNDQLVFSGSNGIFALDHDNWIPWPEQPRSAPHAFLDFEGDLIAGSWGEGIVAQRWDGAHWQDMGNNYTEGMYVSQFLVYEGQIIAAGTIWPKSNICRWNGSYWEQWYAANNSVNALALYRGDLIIGGAFTTIGNTLISYIARYHDGYWQYVGNGLKNYVYSLLATPDWLYASGTFEKSGLQPLNHTAAWSDNVWAWVELGEGTDYYAQEMAIGPGGLFLGGYEQFIMTEDVYFNGIALWTEDMTPVPQQPLALDFALSTPYPNPFNPCTNIDFTLEKQCLASLEIYDARGRLVRSLLDAQLPAGSHHLQWDGRDDLGRQSAAGTYFARLKAGGNMTTTKLTLVK